MTNPIFGFIVCLTLAAPTATAQSLSFSTQFQDVHEDDGTFTITIVQQEIFVGGISALVNATGGSAVLDEDFLGDLSTSLIWPAGDYSARSITFEICDDDAFEFLETIEFSIIPGGGSPGEFPQTYIRIHDNDGALYAFIDTSEGVAAPDGVYNLVGEQGGTLPVTVKLSEDPTSTVTVEWESTWSPSSGSLTFDGVRSRTVDLAVPESTDNPVGGEFTIVSVSGARLRGTQSARTYGLSDLWNCMLCLVHNLVCLRDTLEKAVLCLNDLPGTDYCEPIRGSGARLSAPTGSRARVSGLTRFTGAIEILRRYRDEVLSSTSVGQQYIAAYEQHSPAMIDAIFAHPGFGFRLPTLGDGWLGGIQALVDGVGNGFVITSRMEEELLEIADFFATEGGGGLSSFIATARADLRLDDITGLTMVELQDRIESNTTPVETGSWGRMKSTFRKR